MTKEDKLAAARQKLKETGKSPVEIGNQSRIDVLLWIYYWGFSTASLILALLGRTAGGYAQRLEKQGWLRSTKTASGNPKEIFTLTTAGLELAEKHAHTQVPYQELDSYRVNQDLIRHNSLAQRETISALNDGFIVSYRTEKILALLGNSKGVKQVDICWELRDYLCGVEVELSGKWGRILDNFVHSTIQALRNQNVHGYDSIIIMSDSPAILARYQAAFQPGTMLNIWIKDKRNHWVVDHQIEIPDWVRPSLKFELIK